MWVFSSKLLLYCSVISTVAINPWRLGLGGVAVRVPTSEAAGSNLGPGASCWKVGSYLPMPSGL